MISAEILTGLINTSLTLMTPLLLVGIVELFVERSGVLNLSVEGMMLMGAFVGFMVAYYIGSFELALLSVAVAGILVAVLFGFLIITLALDQMVTGLAINFLMIGITSYLYRASFGWYVSPIPPHIKETLKPVEIPFLSQIPFLGEAIFSHLPHTYIAFVLVAAIWWFLFKTETGLKIRAVGEDPQIADYLGINVNLIRYVLLIFEGIVAASAGALLSIGYYNMFLDNMTAGRGYIAVALVIFARWDPRFLIGATLLFSFIDALQLRIQAAGIVALPYQFALMLPYVVTIILLVSAGQRVKGPSSLAKPFKKVR